MMPPTFSLEEKAGRVFVTFDRKDPVEAVVFVDGGKQGVAVLQLKYPSTPSANRSTMIRFVRPGEATVELYFESTNGRSSYMVSELFKRAK
jgi:hypothetical protein